MSAEKCVNFFRSVPEFDERMTHYQVEYIAGVRGSQTKYIPLRCGTLCTHGMCDAPDDICKRIRHPQGYYRRKLRTVKAEVAAEAV